MIIRAVIFDVYNTLLEVGPRPANAEEQWQHLCNEFLGGAGRLSLAEFAKRTECLIGLEHTMAKAQGIAHPEINWPELATRALPELSQLPYERRDEFLFRHAQLTRSVLLSTDATEVLRFLARENVLLGIASNAQAYTLRELERALDGRGLSMPMFSPELSFWSFRFGFSKPDPHVFRMLTARLKLMNVTAAETLMVGDRLDNDILPAQGQGWQIWQLRSAHGSAAIPGGDWRSLGSFVNRPLR
ncbi:MAG: HAD family hydrolase [Verrucomicrobia bacterium]|nr:HAD family hydrolase [Verrucomicrobiota bacterium]